MVAIVTKRSIIYEDINLSNIQKITHFCSWKVKTAGTCSATSWNTNKRVEGRPSCFLFKKISTRSRDVKMTSSVIIGRVTEIYGINHSNITRDYNALFLIVALDEDSVIGRS